jgi:hypothetical protein
MSQRDAGQGDAGGSVGQRLGEGAGQLARAIGVGAGRVARAWRTLPHERRLAALAAIGLFLALFLPWYQETVIATATGTKLQSASATLTGWGAFSFVEAAVLLVALGVLTLLFQRVEGHAFHVPGGDGGIITAAGVWTCVLVIWRIFDKQGTSSHGQFATTSGIEWGIFVALLVAGFLAYTGSRISAAHVAEPPLPGENDPPEPSPPVPPPRRRARPPRPVADEPSEPSPPTPVARRERPPRPDAAADAALPPPPTPVRRRARPPRPVAADDPPTMRISEPSTPAARLRPAARTDDPLTIPLDPDRTEKLERDDQEG